MSRKKGTPFYKKKNVASSFITTKPAWLKLKAAERRTGKSRSDVITECLMKQADAITKDTFAQAAAPVN